MPSTLPSNARTSFPRRRRLPAALVASAMAVAGLGTVTPMASAASVTSAAFSGGAGTFTAAGGTVFAKEGAALTLTVNTDSQTKCLDLSGAVTARVLGGGSPQHFPVTAGSGNGLQRVNIVVGNGNNANGCNGSVGHSTAEFILDNSAPTATATLGPVPNGAGWNKSDVTVTWTGSDGEGSGVSSVTPATETVTADGTVTRTATVTDNLGHTATSAPVTVKLDKTAPTITGSRTPAANANGWNNTDVTVSFVPSDATSGVKSSTPATVLSANGANQSVTGTVVDNADNTASTTVGGINIDKVAPTLSGKPTTDPNAAGWYTGDVAVAWTAADALSGTTGIVPVR